MKTIKTVEEIQDLVEGYNALLKPQFQMDEAGIICLLNDVPRQSKFVTALCSNISEINNKR